MVVECVGEGMGREREGACENDVENEAVLRGRPVGTSLVIGGATVGSGDALRVGVVSDSVSEKGDVGKTFVWGILQRSGNCALNLMKPVSLC